MEIPAFWVRHVAISVADLEETIAWYRDCLGFVLIGREYVPPVEAEVATMARDGVELEIFCHPGSSPMTEERKDPDRDPHTQGVKHFCLGTDHLEELVAGLREKGVEIVVGPVRMGSNTLYYIHDNSGNPIELMQRDERREHR